MNSNFSAARLEQIDIDAAEPSVEEVLQYLEWLMRWYCREPSLLLATIIVARLEWLRELYQDGEIHSPEWSCSPLIGNWRYLADRCRAKQTRRAGPAPAARFAFAPAITDNPVMSFGITKTVPAKAGRDFLDSLYDGRLDEYEFHMAGKEPKRLKVGDFVYTIFNDELHGRLKIKRFVSGARNPDSGKPRILVIVEAPGEKLARPVAKKGHRGTRYTDGEDWPA